MKINYRKSANLLKISRKAKGVSQYEILGLIIPGSKSVMQISNIENAKSSIPVKHLSKLCSHLDIDLELMITAMISDFEGTLRERLSER